MPVWTLAPAKINLFLHVGTVQPDGYHPLVSLIAFADIGDRVGVEAADALSLDVVGPFAAGLAAEADNLVLRAVRALADRVGIDEPCLKFTLDKQLPVAAGLGGGSSDAGAALRLAREMLGLDLSDAALIDVARSIGADGPMCLFPHTTWAEGYGEVLTPEPALSVLHGVLVNPGVASPTGAVYRTLDEAGAGGDDRPAPPGDWTMPAVIAWLKIQRNDLEAPATALNPAIGTCLSAVAACPEVHLARMSGSGATILGLCIDADAARRTAQRLNADHGDWWVRPVRLGEAKP